jgi:hypothetical protein
MPSRLRGWPGNSLWLLLGLVLGIGLGLFLGWVAWPIEFSEADPTILEEDYQRDYALMIAAAYSLDQDLPTAQQRLNSLGRDDTGAWLLTVLIDQILVGGSEQEIRELVNLSSDLGLYSPAMEPYLPAERGSDR